jgi:hypothetical protein
MPLSVEQIKSLIPLAIAAGSFVASIMFTLVTLLYRFVRSQTTNGDGRTLRRAVDDLADDFREHRHEVRQELLTIKERLEPLEAKAGHER